MATNISQTLNQLADIPQALADFVLNLLIAFLPVIFVAIVIGAVIGIVVAIVLYVTRLFKGGLKMNK